MIVHLIEPRDWLARDRHTHQVSTRCGAVVDSREAEAQRGQAVTCAECQELAAEDDVAIAALKGESDAALLR